jgi:hypothetical protein
MGQKLCPGWWFGTFFIIPYIGNFIIPADFHIFQRGRCTTNQCLMITFQPFPAHPKFIKSPNLLARHGVEDSASAPGYSAGFTV